jgi:glycosyltransferase involved in cell wall biosynthesis
MSSGVPVIATRTGGLGEVVEHEVSGYLADIGDVDAMGAAGVRILREPGTWSRMSASAREAAEGFRVERVVPMYEQYYEKVLASPTPARNGSDADGSP